tara:strand:+ start:2274 stop:2858 length:585 start_codon:yes stop_codon:yes gene_type:complete
MTENTKEPPENINNGMMTKVWGPPGWFFLHCVSFGFPVSPDEDKKKAYKEFFISIGKILPCKYCRASYDDFVKENPPRVSSRDDLVEWLWEIHNKVNEKLGDKYQDASLPEIKERYERYRAKCDKDKSPEKKKNKGCVVPLSGRKMCSEIRVLYCDDKNRFRYGEIEMFVISVIILTMGRIAFGLLLDKLKILI